MGIPSTDNNKHPGDSPPFFDDVADEGKGDEELFEKRLIADIDTSNKVDAGTTRSTEEDARLAKTNQSLNTEIINEQLELESRNQGTMESADDDAYMKELESSLCDHVVELRMQQR